MTAMEFWNKLTPLQRVVFHALKKCRFDLTSPDKIEVATGIEMSQYFLGHLQETADGDINGDSLLLSEIEQVLIAKSDVTPAEMWVALIGKRRLYVSAPVGEVAQLPSWLVIS